MNRVFLALFLVARCRDSQLEVAFGIKLTSVTDYSQSVLGKAAGALGRAWKELGLPTRTLLLALMKTAGGGALGCAVAGAFVLAGPFTAGETWANWALLADNSLQLLARRIRRVSGS